MAAIYAGGLVGALARVGLAQAAPHGADAWPWATFAANMAGALLLGYFVTRLQERPGHVGCKGRPGPGVGSVRGGLRQPDPGERADQAAGVDRRHLPAVQSR